MGKVIRLTESDLVRLVKRIVKEEQSTKTNCTINCMPTVGSETAESKARKSCCRTRDSKSKECVSYINTYRKKDKANCTYFSMPV